MSQLTIQKAGSASDVIKKNNNKTIYANILAQEAATEAGIQVRVVRQYGWGGSDMAHILTIIGPTYFTLTERNTTIANAAANLRTTPANTGILNNIIATRYNTYYPISISYGNGNPVYNVSEMTQTNLDLITEWYLPNSRISGTLDDANIPLATGGMDFYFFGTNYGAANNIYWNSNNAITFGAIANPANSTYLISSTIPAILLGNDDRRTTSFYSSYGMAHNRYINVIQFTTKFANFYTENSSHYNDGQYQVRLLRETGGSLRQWVEVSIIASPAYAGNISQGGDTTKLSPYNITNGTSFFNPCGTTFSTASPTAGTTFLFQSDSLGANWTFINNSRLDI